MTQTQIRPTKAQAAVLEWLSRHPGECVFAYYDRAGTPYLNGLRIVSRRGGAGVMRHRLADAGWIDRDEQITDAGREAIS
jgi:hypothetical protein